MMNRIVSLLVFLLTVVATTWPTSHALADGIKNQGFILNKGQWPDRVLSRATFDFGDVIVEKDGIVFFLRENSDLRGHHQNSKNLSKNVIHSHVYKMKFKNATIGQPQGLEPSAFKINFIKGNDPSKWSQGLSCYRKLLLENVYPNIDILLYIHDTGLKYDLVLRNGANPDKIKIEYEGIDELKIDEEGSLQLRTSLGLITENIPIAFVEREDLAREPVLCKYVIENNTVKFKLKNLSRARQEKLVIDPKLIFATYSGSTADNWGNTATYDTTGCLYAAGIAFDFGFPVTPGPDSIPFNSVFNSTHPRPGGYDNDGDPDVAIMKFNPTGTLLYATYLGGGITETPTSTIVNNRGELYILGTTGSDGSEGVPFPTTSGAYDQSFNGGHTLYPMGKYEGIYHPHGSDLFVTKLDANGYISASTFVGGSDNDGLLLNNDLLTRNYGDEFRSEILLDTLGAVYIASHTLSSDILNPSKPGYDLTYNGGRDGVVIKLQPDLSDVVWNTYWGGSGADACYSLQFGSNNDLFIAGGTTSSDLTTSSNAIHPAYSGSVDGFLFRLTTDGTSLLASSYIGTSSVDQCYLVQTDKDGMVYVLGQTKGIYSVVNAPYSNPSAKQFIHKLTNTLDSTVFSTTIGSTSQRSAKTDFVPTAFLVNNCGNIFISGWGGKVNNPDTIYYVDQFGDIVGIAEIDGVNYQAGNTQNLPTTSNAFQKTTDGSDFYLMVLQKDVQSLLYATYFGGSGIDEHVDGGTSRFDKRGIVYESVCACIRRDIHGHQIAVPNFPVTSGAQSSTIKSTNCNNAVFKFDLSSLKADFTVDTTKFCGISPITFTNTSLGGSSFLWDLGDGTTSTSATSFTYTYKHTGTYVVRLIAIDETTCIGRDTMTKTLQIYDPPAAHLAASSVTVCKGDTAQIEATYNSNYTYGWSPNLFLTDDSIYNPLAFPPSSQVYVVTVKDLTTLCKNKDSVLVKVVKAVDDTRYKNTTGCQGQAMISIKNYSDKDGFTYLWDFGDGSTSNEVQETTHTYSNFGDYIVHVTVTNQSCGITDTVHVHIPPIKIPNLFTPNGDGHNDKYVIEGMTDNWKLEVYNRWGDAIYTRQPYDQTWDGSDLSGGVYYFLITDPAGNKCKGWVEVFK